jgi:sortase A
MVPGRERIVTRFVGKLGLAMMVLGGLSIAWGLVVWQWQDPFTALYTLYEQHELSASYEQRVHEFRPAVTVPVVTPRKRTVTSNSALERHELVAAEERAIGKDARRYRLESHEGEALGRIIVPRLGLSMIFLDGTSESSLERGPGRDLETFMPGENQLVYIAGHRTTYLAPFSHIDALKTGDKITLELPYATFVYSVTRHIIVPANDLAVLRSGEHELLALQACHPRFFATHRYIVYARPVKVIPATGGMAPYTPATEQLADSLSRSAHS